MLIMRIDRRALLATALAAPSVLRERPAAAADDPPWMIMAGQDSGPSAVGSQLISTPGATDFSSSAPRYRRRVADNLWSFDIGTYTWSEYIFPARSSVRKRMPRGFDGSGFYNSAGIRICGLRRSLVVRLRIHDVSADPAGRGPGARSGAKGVIDGQGRFVISHGSYGLFFDDTWAFDSSKGVGQVSRRRVSDRLGATITIWFALPEYGSMLLFGGQAWLRQGDLWVYDFDSASWSDVTPAVGPSPRTGAAMAALGTTLLLVGGDSGLGFMSDVWRGYFDGYTVGWTELTLVNHGPMGIYRRAWHDMTAANGEYYLFGGAGVEDALGDLWRFSLDRFTESDHSLEPSGDDSSDA